MDEQKPQEGQPQEISTPQEAESVPVSTSNPQEQPTEVQPGDQQAPEPQQEVKGEGGQPDNQNALKFDTPEKRQALCDSYCQHKKNGLSDAAFIDCDMDTFHSYCERFPVDFPSDKINPAMREYTSFWEKIGVNGAVGKPFVYTDHEGNKKETSSFSAASWIFNMKNRFGWKDRQDITTNDKELPSPILGGLTKDQ